MDFEDLMNEVESAVRGEPVKPVSKPTTEFSNVKASSARKSDLDDLLELVDEPKASCSAVYLAGTTVKHGQNSSSVNVVLVDICMYMFSACSNLRCNDCDFIVVQFQDKKWHASADYMFFRENVPNEFKLKAKMESSMGSIAYACQCKWLSITDKTTTEKQHVKWCCAGH
ncbi:sporangia induced hypothetical protein [Thraustotheca clavata]|uniref:Cilia- and flagella-associated protein 418 n=1 Tax=Thraustotheca clavata TaxID=74557 RepID=A0A1V9YUE1_9STRA|nr:sporangia induced hypothetical protein [Thraustotheca clavata]